MEIVLVVFFFFQAEDGIRDYDVTGVQTCALPICMVLVKNPVAASRSIWLSSLRISMMRPSARNFQNSLGQNAKHHFGGAALD